MRWLHSGLRRDLCVLLADGQRRGQRLKADLEAHYDDVVAPDRFYGALDALVSAGHVEKRADGVHDVYSLTDAGERGLSIHAGWLCAQVGDGT